MDLKVDLGSMNLPKMAKQQRYDLLTVCFLISISILKANSTNDSRVGKCFSLFYDTN